MGFRFRSWRNQSSHLDLVADVGSGDRTFVKAGLWRRLPGRLRRSRPVPPPASCRCAVVLATCPGFVSARVPDTPLTLGSACSGCTKGSHLRAHRIVAPLHLKRK